MTNRREFLQIGITASAWPLASQAVRAAGAEVSETSSLPLYKVIYDQRLAASVGFANRAQALGLPTHAIEGDMTRFWYDDLYHQWKQRPIAIAGLTEHGPMFCFEQLARDHGMRAIFRAKHNITAEGGVAHELSGPLTMLSETTALNGNDSAWSMCMADVVAECPKGRNEISTATALTTQSTAGFGPDSEDLYTWVIAPAVKA